MALSTTDFESYFHYDEATKQLKFTDITDYVSQGVALADVDVLIKCETASGGIFYNNVNLAAADIVPDSSLNSVNVIALPLDSNSLPLQDLYTITFKSYVSSVLTVTEVKTFTLNYSSPNVVIDMEVDCITPRLTATDESSYTVSGVTPTITRAFSIHYPPSTPTADVTGTGSTLYTATFYTVANSTVEHSSSLTSTLEYDFGDDFYVVDEVTGGEVIEVSCSGDLCDIYCCIRSQWNRYMAVKGKNNVLEQQELAIFYKITSLAEMIGMALKCGKSTQISDYVTEILKLANCDAGCSCNDGTPQIVTGLGAGSSSVTVAEGTGVAVSLAGSTYTVALSTVNIAKLAATYNSVVAAGTNVTSVTSNTVVAGNVTTTTYTVNATDTIVETFLAKVTFTFSSGSVPSYTVDSIKEYGSTFKDTATGSAGILPLIDNINDADPATWQNNFVTLKIQNFFSGAATDYYPEVAVAKEFVLNSKGNLSSPKRFWADIYSLNASDFYVRLAKPSIAVGRDLDTLTSITLIIKIHA
jgi:hypothetical protein